VVLLAFALMWNSYAVVLPEITATTQKALPINTSAPNIPCDQIAQALKDYAKMTNDHDLAVYGFLTEVTDKVTKWYDLLSPLENSSQTLPVGVFAPLQDGSNKITQVADLALENTGLLATEMDRIKVSLEECVLTPK
jgi:hypothetical protein